MEYFSIPLIITVVGGIVIAILSFISTRHESKRKWIPFTTLLTALSIIVSGMFATLDQAKNERDILYSITGGDSYCYIAFGFSGKKTNIIPILLHVGEFPIYDVDIDIADLTMFDELKPFTAEEFLKTRIRHKISILSPGKAYELPLIKLQENWQRQDYNIFFHARNGRWVQQERLRIVDNKFVHATLVDNYDRELKKDVSEDFPLNGEGEVEW